MIAIFTNSIFFGSTYNNLKSIGLFYVNQMALVMASLETMAIIIYHLASDDSSN